MNEIAAGDNATLVKRIQEAGPGLIYPFVNILLLTIN